MHKKLGIVGLLLVVMGLLFGRSGIYVAEPSASASADLSLIGGWDGTTASRQLPGPYIDKKQQDIAFGERSYYLTPWRSYMDTQDAQSLLDSLGINYDGGMKPEYAEATAQALEEAGFRSVRIEIPWSDIRYDDETRLTPEAEERLTYLLPILKKHHLRPLVLLNCNSGMPAPYKMINVDIAKEAKAGEREIYVSDATDIEPGYTGLLGQEYKAMYPIVTSVDRDTGKLTLSDALKGNIQAGNQTFVKLKYQPFAGTKFKDGTVNRAAQETVEGWVKYAATVAQYLKSELGTSTDAGFDIEVWNEYTLNPEFLDINNYYNPKLEFSELPSYSEGKHTQTGPEIILPLTANYVKTHGLPGVNVISGFSNQRPWDNGADMWNNQDGFSKHPYTAYSSNSLITPSTVSRQTTTLNARGEQDDYVPSHINAFPESVFYAYQTEYLTRDTQPYPGPFEPHFRYSNNGNRKPAQLWVSETNFVRNAFANELIADTGIQATDIRLANLMHELSAKAMLRTYVFFNNKGVRKIFTYAIRGGGDLQFATVPDAFFSMLDQNGYRLDASSRSQIGPELQSIGNLVRFMKEGKSIESPRQLGVDNIVEYKPRLVFAGNGTSRNPNRYQGEDLAVLPYQLSDNRFAVGYYVVTRDLTHVWDSSKDKLDPARYDMPDQTYEITLSNVNGAGASVTVYDPISNDRKKAEIVAATSGSITIRVSAADYPRFIDVQEAASEPQFSDVKFLKTASGPALSFVSGISGTVKVTWGKYPNRASGSNGLSRQVEKGNPTVISLPKLKNGDAVRLRMSNGGVTLTYPQWDYDLSLVYQP